MPGACYGCRDSKTRRPEAPTSHVHWHLHAADCWIALTVLLCCALPAGSPAAPAKPSWVREDCAPSWAALATHCGQLAADCRLQDAQLWGPWAVLAAPEAAFPPAAAARLNAFQQLLMVQVRRLPAG